MMMMMMLLFPRLLLLLLLWLVSLFAARREHVIVWWVAECEGRLDQTAAVWVGKGALRSSVVVPGKEREGAVTRPGG